MSWDLVIRRGFVIDGSGKEGLICDVAVSGGQIAVFGTSVVGGAKKIIDADGLVVTPGFIDIKTHSDFVLPINPKAESKVRQGVTTEIIGHCGFSVAPVLPGKAQLLSDYLSGGDTPTPGIASRTSPGKSSHCQPNTPNNSAAVTTSIAHTIGGAKLAKAPMTSDTPAMTKATASRDTENLRGLEATEGSDILI
jgi:N-acyl-D-aspartate/D-glutamate deacylase